MDGGKGELGGRHLGAEWEGKGLGAEEWEGRIGGMAWGAAIGQKCRFSLWICLL